MANCPSCGAPVDMHLEKCPYCDSIIPKEEKRTEFEEVKQVSPFEDLFNQFTDCFNL